MNRNSVLAIVLIVSMSSCRVAYRVLLGVDASPEFLLQEDVERDFRKKGIAEDQRFVLDTASFDKMVIADFKQSIQELRNSPAGFDSLEAKKLKKATNNNLQPVQIRYFTKDGEPIFKLVNCYIDPPIPMSWNVENCFDVFPPAIDDEELKAMSHSLGEVMAHIKDTQGNPITVEQLPQADYYAIVFWNNYMIKPSKKLIKTLKRYDKQHPEQKTHFLFVNNQNASIWSLIDDAQKKEVLAEVEKEKAKKRKK